MSAWTPGPWKPVGCGVRTETDKYVCECSCPHGTEERDATVRLIAAAPDLYAALERIAAYNFDAPPWQAVEHEVKLIASTALAKARGEQSL